MQSKVIIQGLRIYAHHGVMPQEQKTGTYFTIDLEVEADLTQAIRTDDLQGTLSYADLHSLVKHEMAVPSHLVEHAAGRIAKAIFTQHPTANAVRIRLLKENPPMEAECQGAGVELHMRREELL